MSRDILDFLLPYHLGLPLKGEEKNKKKEGADAPLKHCLIKKGVGSLIA